MKGDYFLLISLATNFVIISDDTFHYRRPFRDAIHVRSDSYPTEVHTGHGQYIKVMSRIFSIDFSCFDGPIALLLFDGVVADLSTL